MTTLMRVIEGFFAMVGFSAVGAFGGTALLIPSPYNWMFLLVALTGLYIGCAFTYFLFKDCTGSFPRY